MVPRQLQQQATSRACRRSRAASFSSSSSCSCCCICLRLDSSCRCALSLRCNKGVAERTHIIQSGFSGSSSAEESAAEAPLPVKEQVGRFGRAAKLACLLLQLILCVPPPLVPIPILLGLPLSILKEMHERQAGGRSRPIPSACEPMGGRQIPQLHRRAV